MKWLLRCKLSLLKLNNYQNVLGGWEMTKDKTYGAIKKKNNSLREKLQTENEKTDSQVEKLDLTLQEVEKDMNELFKKLGIN